MQAVVEPATRTGVAKTRGGQQQTFRGRECRGVARAGTVQQRLLRLGTCA